MRARCTRLAALGCLFCRSALADPSAECPKGWYCEAPPEELPSAPSPPPLISDDVESQPGPEFADPDRRFGVQGRFGLALIDDDDSPAHPFMAGVGLGFVFLPLDFVGVELSVDSAFGRDALDAERRELAVSAALLNFLNTHEPVQVFLTTGLFHSWAHVEPSESHARDYRYLGAVLGLGVQLEFQPLCAVTAQIDGFIRGRVDEGAGTEPEFVNQTTGETSNTSAGMLLRLGAVRYF